MQLKENERIDDLGINNLKIVQNTNYFCFGTDSVLLANFIEKSSKTDLVLDLCSGSGVIPIIYSAKYNYDKIFSIEVQDEMYELLEKNVKLNNLENEIICLKENILNISSIRSKIEEITKKNTVNVITVNPPYKPKGSGVINENKIKYIARHEEMCSLEDIFKVSSNLLESKRKAIFST